MPTLFTRIIEGEIPASFVLKDDRCVVFMSINPLRSGHVLVVPRMEVDHWIDCPPDLRDHLMEVASTVGQAIESVYRPTKVGLMIAGLEVPHLHIHLVPIDTPEDLNFANAAATVGRDELDAVASTIRSAIVPRGILG